MKTYLVAATAATLLASPATAELTYGNAFARFHALDTDADSDALMVYGLEMKQVSGAFTFAAQAGKFDLDGGDLQFGTLAAGYMLPNGVTMGLEYSGFAIDDDNIDLASFYMLNDFGPYTLGLSIGDSSDLDDMVYSVFGSWDVTPGGRVGLDILRIDGDAVAAGYVDYDMQAYALSGDFISADGIDVIGLGGGYAITDRVDITASLASFDAYGLEGESYSIGARYHVTDMVNAELAIGKLDLDGASDANLVTLGVQYEMGDRTSGRRSLSNILAGSVSRIGDLGRF